MTKLALSFSLASLLMGACVAEEGYTPVNEEQEDSSGAIFTLTQDNPTAVIVFRCEELDGCDLQLQTGFFGETPDPEELEGLSALSVELFRPDGFSKREDLVVGADNQVIVDGQITWIQEMIGIEAGDYTVQIDLGDLQAVTILAGSHLEPSLLPEWDHLGVPCGDDNSCEGDLTFCKVGAEGGTACSANCFSDDQCPTGICEEGTCF